MKAAPLAIPDAVLTQHVVIYGKTGAGKSSVLRHIVEWLLSRKKRVCIIDPKGDWWGLPSSADAKGAGFSVVLFGDFRNKRSDVPMDARAGKDVANLIATTQQSCVLGFRGWKPGALTQFWLDFAPEIFNSIQGELYIVIDEVHNFAPKARTLSPQSAEALHWTNRLASEGRGLGLKLLIASQRPQKVHNDTASCCETMIAMRVVHPRDRDALKDWIDEVGDAGTGKNVLSEASSMATGEGWVWFPDGKFLQRVKFPMFRSFDSFSEHAIQPPKVWAKVDVEAIRTKLARVVEEKEANDPNKLRMKLALYGSRLQNIGLAIGLADTKTAQETDYQTVLDGVREMAQKYFKYKPEEAKEISVFTDKDRQALTDTASALATAALEIGRMGRAVEDATAKAQGREPEHTPRPQSRFMEKAGSGRIPEGKGFKYTPPVRTPPTTPPGWENNGAITGGKRRMMIALAQRPGLNARQLGVRAGLSSSSGTFGTYLAALRTAGHMEGSRDAMRLTDAGIEALGSYEPLPTGRALLEFWLGELGMGGIRRILHELALAYPNIMTKAELGEAAGISHTSGTFGAYLAKLRTLELISGSSELKASDELFD